MIPIQLTIEGLYSYQQRQSINFSSLTEAGLFGIFGAVGSGKSSILEAITFALYGNSDRLGATNFAYNMMNLKSNKMYIEFEFSNHDNKVYKITREYKRNSKNFDKITNSGVVLYAFQNEKWLPLPSSDIEPIIGLSSENFRRTIIIPQGQFKEFIELKPTARTQMMKDIFNLHRFDLQDKVSNLNSKNLTNLNQLEGKLSGFEEVSEENILVLETELNQQTEVASIFQKDFQQINDEAQRLKMLKSDFENLNLKKSEFQQLSVQKIEIDQQKAQLENYERIYNAFFQILKDKNQYESDLKSKSEDQENQQKQLTLTEHEIKEITSQLERLKPDFDALPAKRLEEQDLEFLIQIKSFQQEIKILKNRTKKGSDEFDKVKNKEKDLANTIKTSEDDIKNLNENRIDSQVLMQVGNWFLQQKNLTQAYKTQQQKVEQQQQKVIDILKQFSDKNINPEAFEEDYNTKNEQLSSQKKNLEAQKNQLNVQQQLSQYTHNLHDGEPCPLCGALEHPSVIALDDVSSQLISIQNDFKTLEAQQSEFLKQYHDVKNMLSQKQFFESQIKNEESLLKDLEAQIIQHQKNFVWKAFDANNFADFEQKKNASLELEKLIELKNQQLAQHRNVLEIERQHLEKYTKVLEQFKLEEAQKNTQIEQNKANLKILNFIDFTNHDLETIQQLLIDLKQNNLQTEENYNLLNQSFNTLNPKLASQKTSIEITKQQILNLKSELNNIHKTLQEELTAHDVESLEKVQKTLSLRLDVISLRKQIEDFTIRFESLKNLIHELELKLKNLSFDEEIYQAQELKLTEINAHLKLANEQVTTTKAEINRLTKAFEAKKDLLKELDALKKRGANLQTMRNLFNSAGFVQYVSSIYLKQLCDNANIRFHRMTRNQLSLQINENHDFEIIDYLNEGKSRSVKTLSGGQSFQVSLSLALALAESVQTNAKADRNFFFIDEGFGTQDSDSVNIVFETLMSLQKENRIVGIISHVEELKERIPMTLSITKEEEKGSLINMIG